MYYRVAVQVNDEPTWKWKSTVLSSLNTLFQFFRLYSTLPHDQLLVFSSPQHEGLDEMLKQENNGFITPSVTAEQFLQDRRISIQGGQQARSVGEPQRRQRSAITAILPPLVNEKESAEPPLIERSKSWLEQKRYEIELGAGGDHDQPYTFTLPISLPQWSAWIRLLSKVRDGKLEL